MCVIIHIYSTLKVQWWGYLKELFQQGSKSGLCLILNSLVYFKSKALICQQINPYFLPQLFPREIHYWKLLMVSEGLWWFMYVMSWARYMRSKRVGDSVPCNQNSCQRCVCVCVCVRVCVLPAIADLPWWVAEMLGCFNPVRRTGSTSSPMGSIGMIGCQWMYLWNVCERWVEVCITVLSTTTKWNKLTFEIWNNNKNMLF